MVYFTKPWLSRGGPSILFWGRHKTFWYDLSERRRRDDTSAEGARRSGFAAAREARCGEAATQCEWWASASEWTRAKFFFPLFRFPLETCSDFFIIQILFVIFWINCTIKINKNLSVTPNVCPCCCTKHEPDRQQQIQIFYSLPSEPAKTAVRFPLLSDDSLSEVEGNWKNVQPMHLWPAKSGKV